MLLNVPTRRKLELSSWNFDMDNKSSRKQFHFHELNELSYVIDYSEIVIVHDSIKL